MSAETDRWVDKHGDVWTFDEDGTGHSFETADFPREYVERKWGPLRRAEEAAEATECLHPGTHTKRPVQCIDCGRFCSDSWDTGWFSTENGSNQDWGGTCSIHGEWSESAA